MKTLYYATHVLWIPVRCLAYMLYGASSLLEWISGHIHDKTTYRVWLVLHNRECEKMFPKKP